MKNNLNYHFSLIGFVITIWSWTLPIPHKFTLFDYVVARLIDDIFIIYFLYYLLNSKKAHGKN